MAMILFSLLLKVYCDLNNPSLFHYRTLYHMHCDLNSEVPLSLLHPCLHQYRPYVRENHQRIVEGTEASCELPDPSRTSQQDSFMWSSNMKTIRVNERALDPADVKGQQFTDNLA